MPAAGVTVVGLDKFRKELRKVDPALGKEMGGINKKAAEVVLSPAIANALSTGGAARKGVKSMTASRKQKAAIIAIGGAKNPWMIGAEFGAKRYKQFGPWRGNQWTASPDDIGYFLHPAIISSRDKFEQVYFDELGKLTNKAFPK